MNSCNYVWVTRTFPGNAYTSHALRALGFRVLGVPILRVRGTQPALALGEPTLIVFTSAHGVRFHPFQTRWAQVPVYTVGDRTAAVARGAGYRNVRSASGNLGDLLALIKREVPRSARVAYFSACEPAGDLAGDLGALGYDVARHMVYETVPVVDETLARATAELDRVEAVLIHSAKAGEAVARIVAAAHWSGIAFCMSEACAAPFGSIPGVTVRIAAEPTEKALIALLRKCDQNGFGLRRRYLGAAGPELSALGANDNDRTKAGMRGEEVSFDDPPPSVA